MCPGKSYWIHRVRVFNFGVLLFELKFKDLLRRSDSFRQSAVDLAIVSEETAHPSIHDHKRSGLPNAENQVRVTLFPSRRQNSSASNAGGVGAVFLIKTGAL